MGETLETSPKRKKSSQKEVLQRKVPSVVIFHKAEGSVDCKEISVQILNEPQKPGSIEGTIQNGEESSQVEGVVQIQDESERKEERSAPPEKGYCSENNVQIEEKIPNIGKTSDQIKEKSYTNREGFSLIKEAKEGSTGIEEISSKAREVSAQIVEISSKEGFTENEEISD